MPQDQSRERRQGERQHVLEAANKGFSGQGHRSGGRHAQARKGKPDEEKEQGEVKRSEEHTSELQSLMRISYAVFCLKKKIHKYKKLKDNNNKNQYSKNKCR